jgi:8-oxo-dGTP diphosphatase
MCPNPFESGARKNIPAVLIYARSRGDVLMIHRNAPERSNVDYHAGKWNGLGGKAEADESAFEAVAREFHEEAGLSLATERFEALGVLQFPNFKAHKSEDWTVFVFTIELSDAEREKVRISSAEGDLHWIPERDLEQLNLWPGDRHFISQVIRRERFFGTIWYNGPEVVRHDVRMLT